MSNIETAQRYDHEDALARFRERFDLPEDQIYLDGNSLGPLQKNVQKRVVDLMENQWGKNLIGSWNAHHWIDMPRIVGDKIATLIGAKSGEVIACDSISVNLFKLLGAAFSLQPKRKKILSVRENFPTDLYVAQGFVEWMSADRCELVFAEHDDIESALNEDIAVLMLTQVDYRSGAKLDIEGLTAKAHEQGVLVIWDLAHSAGAFELSLDAWNVDFAVGCGYKYLNGGPGAPAFLYAAKRHLNTLKQPLCGWMGHEAPFEFSSQYRPASGIEKFLVGTPNILSLVALDEALEIFKDCRVADLEKKSKKLCEFFLECLGEALPIALASPKNPDKRGAQLAFGFDEAYPLCQALIDEGVVGDYRAPNILRFGFTPLTLRFVDVYRAAEILKAVLQSQRYKSSEYQVRAKVT